MDGICTLANDRVYDQLVALLNSIEVMLGPEFPVCVYPYDDNTSRIAAEIARRPNVELYQDQAAIDRWDGYVRQIWDAHPTARQQWQRIGSTEYHRMGTHRRFCAFEGPFQRFLYMDADTLLMDSTRGLFDPLEQFDWVVHDFQHRDLAHVYDAASPKLTQVFSPERLETEIFCSGLYASRQHLFSAEQLAWLLAQLQAGEADVLYCMAPDQTILNYLVMRSQGSIYNVTLQAPPEARTGCCVTSLHFEEREHILYDRGTRLTYIHYIGLSSKLFAQVCQGENIQFPYRDLFLHYRFLHEPERRPVFTAPPVAYDRPPSFAQRVLRKLKFA